MLNVGQTTSKHTIDVLEQIFAIEGLPDTIVTDNGTQFVSREFEQFCAKFNIRHVTSAVFHLLLTAKQKDLSKLLKRSHEKHWGGKRVRGCSSFCYG